MKPTISVIVPFYNAEAYLAKCIESLIHQTYRALQIILINDGSTDNSHTIAEQYAQRDARIELYTQANQGQSVARNNGLLHATGEWISFVDSDDYLDTDCYAKLMPYGALQDIIHFGFRRLTPDGQMLFEGIPQHQYRYTTPWSRLYRRQWLMDHVIVFPEGMYYEDVVFTIDIWLHKPRQIIVPDALYNYVINSQSTTATMHQADQHRLFRILRDKLHHAPLCHRLLILYTIIRLKFHFKRHD